MDKTIKEKAQDYALSFFLADYDPSLPFDDIVEKLWEGDEDVVVWEVFDNRGTEWVVEHMCDMVESLTRTFEEQPLVL